MRRWLQASALLLAIAGAAAPVVHAQPVPVERREQIKKKIRAMRAFELTEELALDEGTASRLFPLLARFDDETDKLLVRRAELQRRLRRADTMRDPNAVEHLIDEALNNQRAFWSLEDRKIAELRKILTPLQMTKLLIVLPALERKIQTQLRKAIVQRRGPNKPIPVDEDDDIEPDEPRPVRREGPLGPPGTPPPRTMPSSAPGNTPPCDPRSQPCPR
jgi:hypothetical protein